MHRYYKNLIREANEPFDRDDFEQMYKVIHARAMLTVLPGFIHLIAISASILITLLLITVLYL